MRLLAILRIAGRALRRNKLRTLLTMLGIIIGVGAVIATVSIGNGAKSMIEKQIASLGQNVLIVMSGSVTRGGVHSGWGSAGTLTIEDARAITNDIRGVRTISPEARTMSQVAAGNQNWSTQVLGEGDEYLDLRQWPLSDGAMFTAQDVRSANKVAVIGQTTSRQLFGDASPVGQILRIKNVPFVIVGVLTGKGISMMGSDQDDVVIIPFTSAMKRLTGSTTFRMIHVETENPGVIASVQRDITDLLRQRHRIVAGRDDDFMVQNQQEIADRFTATSRTMTLLLGAVAGVSLLVGGIGIMNIMLVSVTERTREIGIRMAVGAKGGDILMQFLVEAVSLSAFGGGIGVGVGAVASWLITKNLGWPTQISPAWTIIALVFSAAVGIVFGFYPAHKASRLDPIDALRFE